MKEFIDLQARVTALAPQLADGDGLDFSRDETSGDFGLLSPELRDEIDVLRQALAVTIPGDFEYFVSLAEEGGPFFGLEFAGQPTGPAVAWNAEESILAQLVTFDWGAARERAQANGKILAMIDRSERQPSPAKGLQRKYRREAKDFVRQKRLAAGGVHVLYMDEQGSLLEVAFEDGETLREMLPRMISRGEDVFAVVAYGKPLPVERIDALNAQAHRTFQDLLREKTAAARAEFGPTDDLAATAGHIAPVA